MVVGTTVLTRNQTAEERDQTHVLVMKLHKSRYHVHKVKLGTTDERHPEMCEVVYSAFTEQECRDWMAGLSAEKIRFS